MPLGMITRHFEHPSGATATLEMPAGWSRNCYYVLGGTDADGKTIADRQTFATPEAARAAAVAREREALANGWRPRIGKPKGESASKDGRIYRSTGEPLHLGVLRYQTHSAVDGIRIEVDAICRNGHQMPQIMQGDRLLVREYFSDGSHVVLAAQVAGLQVTLPRSAPAGCKLFLRAVQMEDSERQAIERFSDVAVLIGDLADDPDQSLKRLWEQIAIRMPDADSAKLAEVQQLVLAERSSRQAAEARAMLAERDRARAEVERAVQREMLNASRPRQAPSRTEATEEAIRRLAGGQDLGKPKRRQINLE